MWVLRFRLAEARLGIGLVTVTVWVYNGRLAQLTASESRWRGDSGCTSDFKERVGKVGLLWFLNKFIFELKWVIMAALRVASSHRVILLRRPVQYLPSSRLSMWRSRIHMHLQRAKPKGNPAISKFRILQASSGSLCTNTHTHTHTHTRTHTHTYRYRYTHTHTHMSNTHTNHDTTAVIGANSPLGNKDIANQQAGDLGPVKFSRLVLVQWLEQFWYFLVGQAMNAKRHHCGKHE